MKKNRSVIKADHLISSLGSGAKPTSRRKVLKGLVLAPIQWVLFRSVVNARDGKMKSGTQTGIKEKTNPYIPADQA